MASRSWRKVLILSMAYAPRDDIRQIVRVDIKMGQIPALVLVEDEKTSARHVPAFAVLGVIKLAPAFDAIRNIALMAFGIGVRRTPVVGMVVPAEKGLAITGDRLIKESAGRIADPELDRFLPVGQSLDRIRRLFSNLPEFALRVFAKGVDPFPKGDMEIESAGGVSAIDEFASLRLGFIPIDLVLVDVVIGVFVVESRIGIAIGIEEE